MYTGTKEPELRLKAPPRYTFHKLDAATALTRMRKILPTLQVPMKTFGPDQGELHDSEDRGSIGKLNDVVVTLMRLTQPNTGAVSLEMSLEYFATSDESRAPERRSLSDSTRAFETDQPTPRGSHWVNFRNAAGELVHRWWVGQNFALGSGWNRRHCIHGKIETNVLDWFDAVDRYQWELADYFIAAEESPQRRMAALPDTAAAVTDFPQMTII